MDYDGLFYINRKTILLTSSDKNYNIYIYSIVLSTQINTLYKMLFKLNSFRDETYL